jgi:rare lipoprotein A
VPEVKRDRGGLGLRSAIAIGIALGATGCVSRPAPAVEPARVAPREPARGPRVVRVLRGKAVWYGGKWHGRRTASGERFNKRAMTAAHRSLPLGSRIRVTNLANRRAVFLRVNDRGPYGRDRSRVIDVSEAAARRLGFHRQGWTRVKIEVLADTPARRARDAPARQRRKQRD